MQLVFENIEGNGAIYLDVMRAICGYTPDKSMCDLMCHTAPYTPQLGFKIRTYVDIQNRGLDFKEEEQFLVHQDVFDFLVGNSFVYDCMINSDGIEHLSKQKGRELTWLMEAQSHKQILFTPLGECGLTTEDHPDSHRSGWLPEDFNGYASIVFPQFHKQINHGAFFVWKCDDIEQSFKRVQNELKNKSWTKLN